MSKKDKFNKAALLAKKAPFYWGLPTEFDMTLDVSARMKAIAQAGEETFKEIQQFIADKKMESHVDELSLVTGTNTVKITCTLSVAHTLAQKFGGDFQGDAYVVRPEGIYGPPPGL